MKTIRQGVAATSLLAAIALLSGCGEMRLGNAAGTTEPIVQRSFQVSSDGFLRLDSDSGNISVTTGADNMVRIELRREVRSTDRAEAERILAEMDLDFRQDGNDVHVRVRQPNSFWSFNRNRHLRLHFTVSVPARFNVDLKTGGGKISVNDLNGTVHARTSGGGLQLGRITGAVDARTSGGNIELEGGGGPVEVHTSGGHIRIGRVGGAVNAHTSGGSISVEEVQGNISASTSGGSVNASLSRQPEAECDLSTSGGSIHVLLGRDLNLNLSAHTSGGSIRSELPLTVQGQISTHRLEGRLNNGGPLLKLHTSGGSISIAPIR